VSIRIHNGTPILSGPSLCLSCRHSQIITDHRSEDTVLCHAGQSMNPMAITRPVIRCNEYENENTPSMFEMQKIAWKISVDKENRPAGFLPPKKWKERYGNDDD
jgi:hypothetical protein